jgi:4a-hydroxytetrahydrobiopterin dehydratase
MEERLADKKCVPCEGGAAPLKGSSIEALQRRLEGDWRVVDEHHLEKEFKFGSYREGIAFVNLIADIAEEQQHHPDLVVGYAMVNVQLWTHKIGGLSENDFIMAAKIEEASKGALHA